MTREPYIVKISNGSVVAEFFYPGNPEPYLQIAGSLSNKQVQSKLKATLETIGIYGLFKPLIELNKSRGY